MNSSSFHKFNFFVLKPVVYVRQPLQRMPIRTIRSVLYWASAANELYSPRAEFMATTGVDVCGAGLHLISEVNWCPLSHALHVSEPHWIPLFVWGAHVQLPEHPPVSQLLYGAIHWITTFTWSNQAWFT